MLNQDIYSTHPSQRKLANEGVANVNDDKTAQALKVLRYELETFVCDGQYERGMAHILETYLKNVTSSASQQPAVWISGFFGSGKSHLVKMLRALWVDNEFEDGATARGIANLPASVLDPLKELSIEAKKHGGLHAASGTLGSGASGSVRLALMSIIFKSVNLPGDFARAKFVMWLRSEGILDDVKSSIQSTGHDWETELDNFYVAEGLHAALCKVKPNLFSNPAACSETLSNLYPFVQDISNDDMIKGIKQALTIENKFPLTLVVLDEIQQYIGESSQRSIDVQEVVESCCKNIGSKLLFIGTGQTAVTGTSNLKKLEGRFTIRVELSDSDVDAVIRQVILAKKPEAKAPIENVMQENLGEISRHLGDTKLSHQQDDIAFFAQDYPILPVRRRFWENVLRVLDQTGTDSQLRNQLSMIHKVIQTNLEQPIGSVVAADFIYFDSADKLIQSRTLPRKVHEKTLTWAKGTDDQKLMARACGLIFLINKLSSSNRDIGIKSNVDTVADLLVEDITAGSANLRSRLQKLLNPDHCDLLIQVGDEYRIQTEESQAWNDDFLAQKSNLANEAHRVEAFRDGQIKQHFVSLVRKTSLLHGESKVSRDLVPIYDSQLPADANEKISVWVRDGWATDENSVRADARQQGQQSPVIFVFIPKRSADGLRESIINFKAAEATLGNKGVPTTPEGKEAHDAMETTKRTAESRIKQLLGEAFDGARVFQAGGTEITGNHLQDMIDEAAQNSLQRLYPKFDEADHAGWSKVYDQAKKGSPDALKAVSYTGEANKHSVCKALLTFITVGKKGADIRSHFEGAQYGWSRDAVDGALQCLLVAGDVRAEDERGQAIEPREVERKSVGKISFKQESANVTTPQRIQIRKLFQAAGFSGVKNGEELTTAPRFIEKLMALAESAGGETPKPNPPEITLLNDLRLTAGNSQLLGLYNAKDELKEMISQWESTAKLIAKRWPSWLQLVELSEAGKDLSGHDVIQAQIDTIKQQRQLLDDPDSITPLIKNLSESLREELNKQKEAWESTYTSYEKQLEEDPNFVAMEPEQRYAIRRPHQLTTEGTPNIEVSDTKAILDTLKRTPLSAIQDRIAALPSRFQSAMVDAAKAMEPKVQQVRMKTRTLKSEEDIDAWLSEVKEQLLNKLIDGPVLPQ
jgi:hypothetical protein